MPYALEREPEVFIRTQRLFVYFKALKESQYTFDKQKEKTKWEQLQRAEMGKKGDHVMNQEILHA